MKSMLRKSFARADFVKPEGAAFLRAAESRPVEDRGAQPAGLLHRKGGTPYPLRRAA
jgi:hypothetical protein